MELKDDEIAKLREEITEIKHALEVLIFIGLPTGVAIIIFIFSKI